MKILYSITFSCLLSLTACTQKPQTKDIVKTHKYTNHLIHESSPYLLQHAHNPVNWFPWGKKAFEKAKKENKLIIVSIGYAACHWCHVMEQESFEDEEVAKFMNDNLVSIKVDREERPDIDQVYMNAVQLITGRGGWPLNCILLPDGRPIYGGTYFPKAQWLDMLKQVLNFVKENSDKAEEQAKLLTQGVQSSEKIYVNPEKAEFNISNLNHIFFSWKNSIDYTNGGYKAAFKFPLPVSYQFLLYYYHLTKNLDALKAVTTTLNKIADGGIYDQIGGGFARYSTDAYWKVPHFEKMLYDNAQLVSLYSAAFQQTGLSHRQTLKWQKTYLCLDNISTMKIISKNQKECEAKRKEFDKHYLPNVFFSGGKSEGTLPLLKNKLIEGQTTIYICQNKICKLPVTEVEKALRACL